MGCCAFSRTSRRTARQHAVDERRARPRRRTSSRSRPPPRSPPPPGSAPRAGTASGCSISISATRMMLRSSGWIRSTDQPCAWRSITSSSSSRAVGGGVRQRAREQRGVAARASPPAAGRSGRAGRARSPRPGADRSGASRQRPRRARRSRRSACRRGCARPARRTAAPGSTAPVSSVAGLVPPPETESPRSPGSVCGHLEVDGARQLHVGRLVVDEQHVDLAARLASSAARPRASLSGDRDLLEGLGVHEVRVACRPRRGTASCAPRCAPTGTSRPPGRSGRSRCRRRPGAASCARTPRPCRA